MTTKWKALIIDDNPDIRWVLCRVLAKHDVETVEAQDGEEGIKLLDRESFDIVVTDVSMPKADGFAALEHARKLSPNTPVVMISGSWSSEQKALARKLGATRTLNKPIEIASFGKAIEGILTSRTSTHTGRLQQKGSVNKKVGIIRAAAALV